MVANGIEISPVWEVVRGVKDVQEAPGSAVSRGRDAVLRRALALGDLGAVYAALLFAVLVVDGGAVHLRPAVLLLAPFIVLLCKAIGLYDRDEHILRKSTIDEIPSIVHIAVWYSLTVWLAEALLFDGQLARAQVFGLTVSTFVFLTFGRWLARTIALSVTPTERCVVLGDAADAKRIANKLSKAAAVNATVIGRIALHDVDESELSSAWGKVGDFGSLARVIADHKVERVIIAPGSNEQEEIIQAIRLVKVIGVKVSVLPRLLEVVGSSSTFDEVDGITLLGIRAYGLSKSSWFLKRSMDVVVAVIGLVLLGPLLLALAIAIKFDSRGPVFFRQPRIGRRGERFWMIKFRSMVQDADRCKPGLRAQNEAEGGLFKIRDDPRITRVGKILRQTSLDELPQLLNVLTGAMSLVGPRPFIPDEDALIEGWQRRRLVVRPGMTGLWQIFGSSHIPMHEMVKIDYLYGANWSIWLDLKILLRTVPYVISRRGQ